MPHGKMVRCFVLALVAVFATVSWAQSPIGAVVQTWTHDPATNLVTLKIVNRSHKDITAFNIAIKETYADGHVSEHELLEELIGKILRAKELQGTPQGESFREQFGDGGFHPGEVRDELLPVAPGLTNVEAVIDVVTYTDSTADSANNDGLQRIVDERKATVASKTMARDIIRAALADPNDADPSTTASKKMRDQAKAWNARSHTTIDDLEPTALESMADEVTVSSRRHNKLNDKRDALKQFADREDVQISMLAVHTSVKKTGGPQ